MAEALRGWLGTFEGATLIAERIIDVGEQVVVIAAWRGRGKASGVETEWRHGQVRSIRDGKVLSIVSHADPDDALDAVGLAE